MRRGYALVPTARQAYDGGSSVTVDGYQLTPTSTVNFYGAGDQARRVPSTPWHGRDPRHTP